MDLHRAIELIFDGILEGNNFAPFVVRLGERGVKGRGFSAAGGSREQHQTLGQLGELAKEGFLVWLHAELAEVEKKALPTENAQTHRFAEIGRASCTES